MRENLGRAELGSSWTLTGHPEAPKPAESAANMPLEPPMPLEARCSPLHTKRETCCFTQARRGPAVFADLRSTRHRPFPDGESLQLLLLQHAISLGSILLSLSQSNHTKEQRII